MVGLMSLAVTTPDTLIVPVIGDSNNDSGEIFDAAYDLSVAGIYQIKHDFTVVQAQEPLDYTSMNPGCTGSVTKLCQLLLANGRVPPHVQRIVIVPCAWAGTGLNFSAGPVGGYWNVNGQRFALDGGNGLTNGFYAMMNKAKALFPNNKIWFIDHTMGANDGGASQANETLWIQQLFAEIQGHYSDAATCPILFTGLPPDRSNALLGGQTNLNLVSAALQNIGSNLSNAFYIDPTGLASNLTNGFVHFNAASHRGGVEEYTTTGTNGDGSARTWSSSSNYTYAGTGGVVQTVAVASDGFLYSCIQNNTNVNPAGNANPSFWTQIRQVGRTINVNNSLAGLKYQALISSGLV